MIPEHTAMVYPQAMTNYKACRDKVRALMEAGKLECPECGAKCITERTLNLRPYWDGQMEPKGFMHDGKKLECTKCGHLYCEERTPNKKVS
jgi:predicted RNA-binding Zn-ribbon protein involved in translation (DUF1610 family)